MTDVTDLRSMLARIVPPWMSARPLLDRGFRYLYTFGLLADTNIEALEQGIQAKLPGVGTPTALPRIGRDRQILRGLTEPDEPYVQRLLRWREDHKRKGNAYTLMHQVRAVLHPHTPKMRVVNARGTWYTLNPDDTLERVGLAGNLDWDGQDHLHARFWLVIYPAPELWVRDGTWDDGELWGQTGTGTWGSSATIEEVRMVRHVVKEWKSAGGVCVRIIVAFDEDAFDPLEASPPNPDGTWANHSKNVAGVQVPARDDRAIYWQGVAA